MKEKILFVDDEDNLLSAVRRLFRNKYDLTIVHSPEIALEQIEIEQNYSVIVSDMKMPGMDGIEFLKLAKQKSPKSIRIMMTGNADQETARTAINESQVYKFISKPCSADEIEKVVSEAVQLYKTLNIERTLLEETLQGSVSLLSDILSLTAPDLFYQASEIQPSVEKLAQRFCPDEILQVKLAVLFSDLPIVVIPEELLKKAREANELTTDESHALYYSLDLSKSLLNRIPRLQKVSDIVFYQFKNIDGTGEPRNQSTSDIPIGSKIIRVCKDYYHIKKSGKSIIDTFKILNSRKGIYDPEILRAFAELIIKNEKTPDEKRIPRPIGLAELTQNQRLEAPIYTNNGLLLFAQGTILNRISIQRIINHSKITGIKEPIIISEIKRENV